MAGLAASIGSVTSHPGRVTAQPGRIAARAVADALAARGSTAATWRAGDVHLAVRAGMPAVHRIGGLALVVDGPAAPSVLAAGYARDGAVAVLAGPDPYAVILADPTDPAGHTLLLARHGDGPPLYWTRRGAAVLAASEPAALLAAGGPATPDPAVVDAFLATGTCDGGAATFFAGIRRVLPGQVVEVRQAYRADLTIQLHNGSAWPDRPAATDGRVGVRLGYGEAGLAVLEEALLAPDLPRPLPVYSAAFPELAALSGGSGHGGAAGLGRLGRSATVRHRALPFFADEIDVDAYLADLGEPTPHLDDWLLWAVARRVAGEVDVLVDAAGGAHRSRLADRIATRFGVALRPPSGDPAGRAQPAALLADLLRRLRAELVPTFLDPRHRARRGFGLTDLMGLLAGERVDPEALWRRYVLERWLRCVVGPANRAEPATRTAPGPATRAAPGPVTAAGARWTRTPVRTEVLAAGDKIPEKIAWYVGEAYAGHGGPVPAGPWYVLVAAKPVAVMQGRARSLWEIHPGFTARLLPRLTGRRAGAAAAWAAQVAIDEVGWWRTVAAHSGALLGRPGWDARLAGPAGCAVRPPREDAVPPGQVAVVPAPVEPTRVAADVVVCLRTVVPQHAYTTLGGCAVVAGELLLGWATRPGAEAVPAGLPRALCAGDPFGDDHTPIVLALPAATDRR